MTCRCSSTRKRTILTPVHTQRWQQCVFPFLRAPEPVLRHFHMLLKSCGLQTTICKIAGPKSDASKPSFLTFSKNLKNPLTAYKHPLCLSPLKTLLQSSNSTLRLNNLANKFISHPSDRLLFEECHEVMP